MMRILIMASLLILLALSPAPMNIVAIASGPCPTGQMQNFDGSCIGDPNYNAGPVKNTENTNTQTTPTPDVSSAEESQQNAPSLGSTPSPKSIGAFSSEGLDQQNVDGNQLISDVSKIKQMVSAEVSSIAGKYPSEVYQQASKIQDDADKISSAEYTSAQNDANSLGAQMKNCERCYRSEGNSSGCQCLDSFQRQINIGSYGHFMKSFQAQQDALSQIKTLAKNSKTYEEKNKINKPENTNTSPQTNRQKENPVSQEKQTNNVAEPSLDDSAALMESVAGPHNDEVQSIQDYYDRQSTYPGMTQDEEGAKKKLDEIQPLGVEVVNAKNDYQDALKKRASESELTNLKSIFDAKVMALKSNLQNDVLVQDSGNAEALWQLGTVSKWEGDNRQSYEYYREALVAAKSRNPFQYQQLLDSINNPAIKIQLLQSMAPNEKIITLPTTETSPILKKLKNNLDALVQPVKSATKAFAENIEKISRAFSISDRIQESIKGLGISIIGNQK